MTPEEANDNWEAVTLKWRKELKATAEVQSSKFWAITWSQHKNIPSAAVFLTQLEDFLRTKHCEPEERINTERFAFYHCHYHDWEAVLNVCLKYSRNPLLTAIEVSYSGKCSSLLTIFKGTQNFN